MIPGQSVRPSTVWDTKDLRDLTMEYIYATVFPTRLKGTVLLQKITTAELVRKAVGTR